MKKKIQAGQTIWTFLNALSEHVITPTTFEIRQLDNNKQPRRAKSKATLLNQRIIKIAEDKLAAEIITPIQFLDQMSHHFSSIDITPEERVALEQRVVDEEALLAEMDAPEELEENQNEEAEIANAQDPKLCKICLTNSSNWAFVPCGHRCACTGCKDILLQIVPLKCPICRDISIMVMQVFDS
jgi:hypothetical protein